MQFGVGGDGLAELGDVVGAEQVPAAVGVRADAFGQLLREGVDDAEGEVGAGEVVRQAGGAGPAPGLVHQVRVQDQIAVVVRDHDRPVRQGLPVRHEARQRIRHRRIALDPGGPGRVGAGGGDAREELAGRGEQHTGLTERGQHLADVAEERRVGPDDQHRAPGQLLAVGVEQIRGAVQGDDGLAGAGAALHDEDAAVRGADDPVLVGLDGLHDVVHPAGARGIQRGQQNGVRIAALVAGACGVGEVEDLVVQGGHPAALGGEMAPAAQPHRRVAGGEIKRPGDLRAPVDDERGTVRVVAPDSDPADVVIGAVTEYQTAEAQAVLAGIERGQKAGQFGHQHIAFQPRLMRGTRRRQGLTDRGFGGVPQCGEVIVDQVEEFLLRAQFLGRRV